jgi:outer membrane protein
VQLNDLLQTKVSLLTAKKAVANAQLQLEIARQGFVKYLNLDREIKIGLVIPEDINNFEINEEAALEHAKRNRKSILEFQRRRLEAEQSLARSKSETGPELSIRSNIGFSQRGNNLNQAYNQLLNNQTFVLGISIPLVDWGVNKSNRKRAEASLELEKNNISQQMMSIEQEIVLQVMKWGMLKDQLAIAKEARELANRRYEIARQKFTLGTLNFTDFNNAQFEKDRAVIDYINNLRNYWSLYYLIRRLTHYDFQNDRFITLEDLAK